jgi:outer membrane protein assembly factor BamA
MATCCLLLPPRSAQGQEFIEDITRFFEFELGKERPDNPQHYTTKLVLAPVISYEPTTSLGVGAGAKLLFKFPESDSATRTSNIPISAQYTLRNQFFLFSEPTIFTNDEQYLIKGEVSYYSYPVPYFGLGNQTRSAESVELNFNQLLWEPIVLRRVADDLFVGTGLRYNRFTNVRLIENSNGEEVDISYQDSLGFRAVGLEAALTYDSRDNVLNAMHGALVEFTYGVYGGAFGSTDAFTLSRLDVRKYWTVGRDGDALAAQFFGRRSSEGTPVLEQSTLGGMMLLRGYPEGRFRDRQALFGQVEYRWQALERLGMVFFAGMGEVGRPGSTWALEQSKYSVGSGLRIKIVKSENLNIRIDYGLGFFDGEAEGNWYLNIAEAF